jgi:hypothetical protein
VKVIGSRFLISQRLYCPDQPDMISLGSAAAEAMPDGLLPRPIGKVSFRR